MAVTDHDTIASCGEVAAAAGTEGIQAIPGIEITAVEGGRDVHVLGYFVRTADPALAAFLSRQRADRISRVEAMGLRLAELGVPVDVSAIVASGRREPDRAVGRPQVARAMVDAGHVPDTRAAFDRWLGDGCPAFVPRGGPGIDAVINAIHAAGGIASIAHPGKTRIDARLPALAAAGLDALEAFHPDHDAATVVRYTALANDLGLLLTGGSDFHGDPGHGMMPGSVCLPSADWERLLERQHTDGRG